MSQENSVLTADTLSTGAEVKIPTEVLALRGSVSVVCTTGFIQSETQQALSDLRDWNTRHGLTSVEYRNAESKLVESGRDAVAAHALQQGYDYFLMVDGDAAPFAPHALARLLQIAFQLSPHLDVVGAYCQVKGGIYAPTIDTGTGTWQPEPAYQGTLPVIRTGGHFLLVKTRILRAFGPPWFRTRQALTPLKVLQEFDNYARCHLDGENPLHGTKAWYHLMDSASGVQAQPSHIGEDSGFCDAVRAAGGHIAVDTDLVVGHVTKDVILPRKMVDTLNKIEEEQFAVVGVKGYR